uniref:Fatty acyl-CoA reductase n=2 Tax=Lygus hesperus TaxID=30085 RepID=A0A0A9XQ07_LYGHE
MAVDVGGSEIVKFYRGKTIFITGGTGFIGRVLVEHLMRKCGVHKIYVLVRAKKGVEPKDRKHSLFNVPLFDELRAIKPNFVDSIIFINGDISEPDLGIDEVSRVLLTNDVQVVFHIAATVNLQANLKKATSINVRGTQAMCRLCSKMKKIEAFVYVSTAYAHSNREEIGEVIYDAPIDADNLMKVTESLSDDQVDRITKHLLCGWQNSYTFTKAVSENLLKAYVDRMPICVVRPGLVISTKCDPIEGWVDNIYGPMGFVSGTATGVLRVSNVDLEAKTEFVPADFVCSTLIASACKTAKEGSLPEIPVYNVVSAPENPINYGEFNRICTDLSYEHPPSYSVWHVTHTCIKNRLLYLMAAFWFHIFPAVIVDLFLKLTGKTPKVRKIYNKIHTFVDSVAFVSNRSWTFGNTNIRKLREDMNETDKKLFNFDMSASNVNWRQTVTNAANGVSCYLFNEDLFKSTAQAKRRAFWLHVLHRTVQVAYVALFYWLAKMIVWTIQFTFNSVMYGVRYAVCDVC